LKGEQNEIETLGNYETEGKGLDQSIQKDRTPLSRKEIAELIDMSTENVIRILSEFRKDNIIRIDGSCIEILNIGQLERICRFG